jgi:hypothetical protein
MAKYLYVYYGGNVENDPKKQKEAMDAWMKWFASMGKAVIEAGNPTTPGKTIGKNGAKDISGDPITGYSIVQAADMDAALKMAKGSPQLAAGGQISVYTITEMM